MQSNKLSKTSRKSWFISRAITTIILLSLAFIGKSMFLNIRHINENINFYVNLSIIMLAIFLLLNTFLYPIIEYKQWSYTITTDKVDFTEGIFFTKRTIVPIIRIQHIKINQEPINRFFNLANITMITAGGSHQIPNLDMETAKKISEYLNNKVKEKVENYAEV